MSSQVRSSPSALSPVVYKTAGQSPDGVDAMVDSIRLVSARAPRIDRLKIHKSCRGLISEIAGYSWSEANAERGEDVPVKVDDHAVDALRYGCATNQGAVAAAHSVRPPSLSKVARQVTTAHRASIAQLIPCVSRRADRVSCHSVNRRPPHGILAGMSSLASLAHEAIGGSIFFNANFYITVSTIIPIFFLALAVQGTEYQDAMRTAITALRTSRQDRLLRKIAMITTGYTFVIGVLVAGFSGEAIAINALYYGSDDPIQRGWTRLATLFLLVAVVARPAWQMAQLPFKIPRSLPGERGTGERQESTGDGEAAPPPELGAGEKDETGKTGAD